MATAPKVAHHHHHDAAGIVREVEHECGVRGLRLTPLRREVLVLVVQAHKPVKAYDLLESLRDHHAGAAPPTIYRALDFLLENGFIHKLESINAFVFCQHPAEAHQVPFLICDVCESATEVCDEGAIARLIEQQAHGFGFRAKAQTLEVHGVCRHCTATAH
jgi:Fur family zinc uptake transcriptional regulator